MDRAQRFGKTIFAVFAAVSLLGYSAGNFYYAGEAVLEEAEKIHLENADDDIAAVNNAAVENMLWRFPLIECYGSIQLAQSKREINSFDLVKDRAGYLHSGNFWVGFHDESKELAVRVRRLYDMLKTRGTQLCFIMSPMKVAEEEVQYAGIPYNDFTGQADEMLRWLRYYGVPYLDLRASMVESGLSYEETFYKTDHHWTPRAAFEGFCEIVEWLNKSFNTNLDSEGYYCSLENYKVHTYKDTMLGSQGRRTGVCYAEGMEDFTVLIPKYEGEFNWIRGDLTKVENLKALDLLETLEDADSVSQKEGLTEMKGTDGLFTETLLELPPEKLEGEDIYKSIAEEAYMEGVNYYDFIRNNNTEDGPSFLFLRDSYASPVISFFAQCVPQTEAVWTGQCDSETMKTLLLRKNYDFVVIMLYPENLQFDFFPFCESEDFQ